MIEKERTEQKETMSGTELIMGMEEVVQHIRELENLKEALAQKFYKHYDEMDYNKLNVARTVGPDLGRMVDHLMEENKRLKEENEELMLENHRYQDPTREEAKLLETMRKGFMGEIEELKKENKKLKAELEDATSREDSMFQTLNKKREEESVWALKKIAQLKDENKELKEELEKAKEVAYHMGVDIFSDDPDEI